MYMCSLPAQCRSWLGMTRTRAAGRLCCPGRHLLPLAPLAPFGRWRFCVSVICGLRLNACMQSNVETVQHPHDKMHSDTLQVISMRCCACVLLARVNGRMFQQSDCLVPHVLRDGAGLLKLCSHPPHARSYMSPANLPHQSLQAFSARVAV